MLGFIFIGIPIICIVALIVLGFKGDEWFGHGASKYRGYYDYMDEDDEISDSFQTNYRESTPTSKDDEPILMTDDDDYLDEFGEDVL